jgi:hypothetical protein
MADLLIETPQVARQVGISPFQVRFIMGPDRDGQLHILAHGRSPFKKWKSHPLGLFLHHYALWRYGNQGMAVRLFHPFFIRRLCRFSQIKNE